MRGSKRCTGRVTGESGNHSRTVNEAVNNLVHKNEFRMLASEVKWKEIKEPLDITDRSGAVAEFQFGTKQYHKQV